MTAPHFFAPSVAGDVVTLEGDEARHAARVLRIRPGERVTVGDGAGSVVVARILEAGEVVSAEVSERWSVPALRPRLVVWQAIPKAGKLDLVVGKLAEVGVAAIVPFAARRSVARWDPAKARARVEHLRAVARGACKQSRRAWLLEVREPASLEEVEAPGVALHEEGVRRLTDALPGDAPEALSLVVGPEGGLAPEEVEILAASGIGAVSLGPQILRTETAALAAAVVVLARYGVLG